MLVPSPEEERGGFGVRPATQPCKKVSATETANSTVSQIYWDKDDDSEINPPIKILDEVSKEVQYVEGHILSAKPWKVRTLLQIGKLTQLIREFDNCMLHILGIYEMIWKKK